MVRSKPNIGSTFGQLTVIGPARSSDHHTRWTCRCTCGRVCIMRADNIILGRAKSCGLGHRYSPEQSLLVAARFPEYRVWVGMKIRCYDRKSLAYKYYGALGVRVCDAWRESFWQFLSDMGPRPTDEHSIDRYPDTHGNYEPGNCRWATYKEQALNKRNTVFVEVNGKRMTLSEFCESSVVRPQTVRARIKKGWSLEEAISTPPMRWRKIAP